MVLSDKDITSFQTLYKETFETEITKEEAYTQAVKLIELVRVVYRPITKEEYKFINNIK